MLKQMSVFSKLNLVLALYMVGVIFLQPLAAAIQIAMLVFMSIKREWNYFATGVLLLTALALTILAVQHYGVSSDNWLQITVIAIVVLLNLMWFVSSIKYLKWRLLQD